MKKLVCLVILIAMLMIFLSSCDRIKVESNDFKNLNYLTPGEFSDDFLEKYYNSDYQIENMYFVKEKDGELFIYNGVEDYSHKKNNVYSPAYKGYFLGVNIGEFGGWLKYYDRLPDDGEPNEVIVAQKNLQGYQKIDNKRFFSFVGDVPHLTYKGSTEIYLMEYIDESWAWKSIATLEGASRSTYYDEESETLYVVTFGGIYSVNLCGEVYSYTVPEYFTNLAPNSSVLIDGVLYIGTWCGVYAQPTDTQSGIFYPIK